MAMALHGATGHATADGDGWLQLSVVAHVLAAGAWIGGLPALWSALNGPDAAALVRRFARLGLGCVVVLVATATLQGIDFAGGLPGLVGTGYGHLLLVKLAMFAGLLAVAARNQFAIGRDIPRLRRSVAFEVGLGVVTLLVASLLSSMPPGVHEQPWWPFAWRPDFAVLADDDLRREVLDAVLALAVAGALLVLATLWRRVRVLLLLAAMGVAWIALPHLGILLVPAEPTAFWESPAAATPSSVALGKAAYGQNCAWCHGEHLRGDGVGAKGLPIPPADLTAAHLWDHRDGQLFWWISDGMRGPDGGCVMPGFSSLDERTRWALIDFIHANNPYGAAPAGTHRH
jgi:mono/diheme cytochrome c family protein